MKVVLNLNKSPRPVRPGDWLHRSSSFEALLDVVCDINPPISRHLPEPISLFCMVSIFRAASTTVHWEANETA